MRLTLRTMLAYLDNVLEPADARELERKIEESSFASGLVHRVRDSMRRMRLGAPKLDGKGLGLDPNTVSEYLDSTLAPERVPEFEKVCLESDVHLAEVASCHQILTLVLGEPAQFEPAMRERAYRIGHPENRQPKQAAAPSGNGTPRPEATEPVVARATTRRASQLSVKSLAITLLLGFFIAFVALQAIGVTRVRSWMGLSTVREVVQDKRSDAATRQAVADAAAEARSEAESRPPAAGTAEPPGSAASDASNDGRSSAPAVSVAQDSPSEPLTKPPVAVRPTEPAENSSVEAPPRDETTASGVVPRPPFDTRGEPAGDELGLAASEPSSESPRTRPMASTGADESAEVSTDEPARPIPVGRYISEEQVLAQFDEAVGDWFRMVPDSPLVTGRRMIALPTYRPQLLLSPNIKLTLVGETHIEFGKADAEGSPLMKLATGRAIVVPLGDPESPVMLEAGGRAGSLVFADADSVVAIEVMNYLPPGQQPSLEPAIPIVQIFALSGDAIWQGSAAAAAHVRAGQVLTMIGEGTPALFESGGLPDWIDGKDLADIDRLASNEMRRDLSTDRPLSLSLLERTEFRQVEVRSLACRSLCAFDRFEPAVEALGGAGLRSYWYAQFDALRGAMARSPESAVKLQRALEKLAGDDAGLMFELLCGFNPDQLLAGGAQQLVDALEHERVSIRVLAYENLRRITDKTQLFRPEQPPSQQKGEVMKWRRNLEAGTIVYQQPPAALPARNPVPAPGPAGPPAGE